MDADEKSGNYDGHYFHQDIIVAKRILEANPKIHMDVGSRVDGFLAHLACFRSVTVIDIRPSQKSFHGISYLQADMMKPLNDSFQGICDSLSCLHALEHFGLGRYGDPIRPDGHLNGFDNLSKMLKIGGKLYLSFPIGPQRIEFNAHRVFSIKTAIEMLSKKFVIDRFAYIDDGGTPHENQSLTDESISNNFNCHYGCGIFEATKISD